MCVLLYFSLQPDPFKLKSGGLVNLKQLDDPNQFSSNIIHSLLHYLFVCRLHDDADEVMKRLSSTFSAETNKREDEERMSVKFIQSFLPFMCSCYRLKYIEEEMKKKKGVTQTKEQMSE